MQAITTRENSAGNQHTVANHQLTHLF